jgi:DNA-binding transcriptional ArsR family regulator
MVPNCLLGDPYAMGAWELGHCKIPVAGHAFAVWRLHERILRISKMQMQVDIELDELRKNASSATAFLRGMANEYRLLILCRLAQSECSVNQLEQVLELSQSALSQHLAMLRRLGLVKLRKQARLHYYSLASEEASVIMATLYQKFCQPRVG